MAVHDDAVFRVRFHARGVAHHMGRELAGELAAVGKAPEQLRRPSALGEPDDPQIGCGIILHILEVFSCAGDQEASAVQLRSGKSRGDRTQDPVEIKVFRNFRFIQQDRDVAAVAFIPAMVIHICTGANQLHQDRRAQNIFHIFSPPTAAFPLPIQCELVGVRRLSSAAAFFAHACENSITNSGVNVLCFPLVFHMI